MASSLLSAASIPTHTASCPSYRWQKPRMNLPLYRTSDAISRRRMR